MYRMAGLTKKQVMDNDEIVRAFALGRSREGKPGC